MRFNDLKLIVTRKQGKLENLYRDRRFADADSNRKKPDGNNCRALQRQ